jgi:hypothetical protein
MRPLPLLGCRCRSRPAKLRPSRVPGRGFLRRSGVLVLLGLTGIGVPQPDSDRLAGCEPEFERQPPRFLQDAHRDDRVVAIAGSLADGERSCHEVEVSPYLADSVLGQQEHHELIPGVPPRASFDMGTFDRHGGLFEERVSDQPTSGQMEAFWDGQRLDSREAVMEWLAEVEAKSAAEEHGRRPAKDAQEVRPSTALNDLLPKHWQEGA